MAVKKKTTQPKPRFLKVGYHYYESQNPERWCSSRRVPYLRLCGDWLQAAGFEVGQKARVQVTKHGIMIVAEE
jgi:toxic protein SymE